MVRRVPVSEDDRPLVEPGHVFEDLLGKRKRLSRDADADDCRRQEILHHSEEIS